MENNVKLLLIGEAMLELVAQDHDTLKRSFAGDVYNTSVYTKRAFPANHVYFMSALGKDLVSKTFLSQLEKEQLDKHFVAESNDKHMGAYMVLNDEHGERSFLYWRNDSAAKRAMSLQSPHKLNEQFDYIFFSGITLAILEESEHELFWQFIYDAKAKGAKIMFDPNYRPVLWASADEAKAAFEKAYVASDWLLPGTEDFEVLYGLKSMNDCIEFCKAYELEELVIKQGEKPVHVIRNGELEVLEIQSSSNVVDTTSAGDAFNGVYIGARLDGKDPKEAVRMANYAAIKVIETKGAIMPKALFEEAMAKY